MGTWNQHVETHKGLWHVTWEACSQKCAFWKTAAIHTLRTDSVGGGAANNFFQVLEDGGRVFHKM